MTLGEKLIIMRHRSGLTMRQLAKRAQVSPSTISRVENDKNAGFWEVARIVKTLVWGIDEAVADQWADACKSGDISHMCAGGKRKEETDGH